MNASKMSSTIQLWVYCFILFYCIICILARSFVCCFVCHYLILTLGSYFFMISIKYGDYPAKLMYSRPHESLCIAPLPQQSATLCMTVTDSSSSCSHNCPPPQQPKPETHRKNKIKQTHKILFIFIPKA